MSPWMAVLAAVGGLVAGTLWGWLLRDMAIIEHDTDKK